MVTDAAPVVTDATPVVTDATPVVTDATPAAATDLDALLAAYLGDKKP